MVQVLLFCGLMAGLYFLRWWTRLLALVIALAVTIAAGFTAGYQTAGLVGIPYSASGYLFGAMLGVAYLTPEIIADVEPGHVARPILKFTGTEGRHFSNIANILK